MATLSDECPSMTLVPMTQELGQLTLARSSSSPQNEDGEEPVVPVSWWYQRAQLILQKHARAMLSVQGAALLERMVRSTFLSAVVSRRKEIAGEVYQDGQFPCTDTLPQPSGLALLDADSTSSKFSSSRFDSHSSSLPTAIEAEPALLRPRHLHTLSDPELQPVASTSPSCHPSTDTTSSRTLNIQCLRAGVHCEVGTRSKQEDCAFALPLFSDGWRCSPFSHGLCAGVFDGHNGDDVALLLNDNIPKAISKRGSCIVEGGAKEVGALLVEHEAMLQQRFESEWGPSGRDPGSTALVATIIDDQLHVANVGDCRMVVAQLSADGTPCVQHATVDHNAKSNPREEERLRSAGAEVVDGYIGSMLECSRSIGDFSTKSQLGPGVIISEPDVTTLPLTEASLFAVLMSDGVSSTLSDEAVVTQVAAFLNNPKRPNDPQYAARELAQYAVVQGSADNCSVVVVCFREGPPPQVVQRRPRFVGRRALPQPAAQ